MRIDKITIEGYRRFNKSNEFRVVSHIQNNLQRMFSYIWFF